jgi:hypothetical protein
VAERGREVGVAVCSMTGPTPNPLASVSDDVLETRASRPVALEVQQVVVHLLCELFEQLVLDA